MEIIKIFSRVGFVIDTEVLSGVVANKCSFSVFNSECDIEGINRENIVRNFRTADAYRDEKDYSIFIDDDVVLGAGAIEALRNGLEGNDVATLPVDRKHSKCQHAIMIIKNDVLNKHEMEVFNLNFCNQCVYVAHLIDKFGKKVNALESPMQRTIKRSILKKRIEK